MAEGYHRPRWLDLARQHGICVVAHSLRLDYTTLKKTRQRIFCTFEATAKKANNSEIR